MCTCVCVCAHVHVCTVCVCTCTRVGSMCQHGLRVTLATSSGGGKSLFFPVSSGIWRTVQRRGGRMPGHSCCWPGDVLGEAGSTHSGLPASGRAPSQGGSGCCWVALPRVIMSSAWPPHPPAAARRVAGVHTAHWQPPRGGHPRSRTPTQPALGTRLLGNRRP